MSGPAKTGTRSGGADAEVVWKMPGGNDVRLPAGVSILIGACPNRKDKQRPEKHYLLVGFWGLQLLRLVFILALT